MPDDEFPTVDDLGVTAEVEQAIADLADLEAKAHQEARSAEEGAVLYESVLPDGGVMRRRKQRTMVHYGGKPLPERVKVFDRQGRPSMVPTAQLGYHLTKTGRDGRPVFFRKPPDGYQEPQPIDETCPICLTGGVRKKFYSRFDHIGHMETFHPREHRIMEEERRQRQHSEPLEARIRELEVRLRTGGEGIAQKASGDTQAHRCECGWTPREDSKSYEASLRAHRRFKCQLARAGG